ncbi:MAG: ATP-binding protein [Fusobacteriota bacterium]
MELKRDLKKAYDDLISVFFAIAEDMTSTFDEEELMKISLKVIKNIIEYEAIVFIDYSESNDMYIIKKEVNYNDKLKLHLRKTINDGLIKWASKLGKPFITRELVGDIKTTVIVPLIYKEKLQGAFLIHTKKDETYFNQNKLKILTIIASQLSIAFENIHLYKNLEKRNAKQEALKNYMNDIIKSLSNGIIVVDEKGIIRVYNRKARKLLGVNEKKVVFRNIKDTKFKKDFINEIEGMRLQTLKVDDTIQREVEYEKKNKEFLPLELKTQVLRTRDRFQGVIFVIRDLRESKELKELKRIDKMKDEFLSMVSHELRTPLTSIKAYTETLLFMAEEKKDKESEEFLEIIDQESDRLGRLINDVLDLSKIESGKMTFILKEQDINPIIDISYRNMKSHAESKNIDLKLIKDKKLPPVKIDKDRILQVLANLINNALKFTEENGKVTVKTERKDEDFILISVSDNGTGIKEEDIENVFEKFKQSENILTRKEGGTGLGLPICKNIIEYHNGEIWAESKLGEGSTFFFTLPVVNIGGKNE